ncbi:MAG: signal peptide peptidase SppA [Thermoplasmata archaeon]
MRERIAIVQFRGTIRERSVEPFVRLLRALRTRRKVKGVLLDISSGGGESIASMDFYLAAKRLDAIKPVVAVIGSMGASGAYLASLGARKIYAYPESAVGSIGVILPHISVQDLLRRLGISVELLHEGRHKDAYQGLRPLREEEREKLMAVVREDYELFVKLVAQERKRPVEEIRALATGEFWTGNRAKQLGLIDELGDRELALEGLAQLTGVPSSKAIRVAPPRPFLERLFSGATESVGPALASRLRESVEDVSFDSAGWFR